MRKLFRIFKKKDKGLCKVHEVLEVELESRDEYISNLEYVIKETMRVNKLTVETVDVINSVLKK